LPLILTDCIRLMVRSSIYEGGGACCEVADATVSAASGKLIWSVDLCTVVNGTQPPCYAATASPTLCLDKITDTDVVLVTVTDVL
jgi:hypothetical protein